MVKEVPSSVSYRIERGWHPEICRISLLVGDMTGVMHSKDQPKDSHGRPIYACSWHVIHICV